MFLNWVPIPLLRIAVRITSLPPAPEPASVVTRLTASARVFCWDFGPVTTKRFSALMLPIQCSLRMSVLSSGVSPSAWSIGDEADNIISTVPSCGATFAM
jgi:hypothetical protein